MLKAIGIEFYDNFELIKNLTIRQIKSNYRDSIFGTGWIIFAPILMLSIYTVYFGEVLGAKWGGMSSNTLDYSVILYAGLLIFNMFAECLAKSSKLILDNKNYVKKIVFPIAILSWVSVLVSLFHLMCGTFIWIIYFAFIKHQIHATILFFPFLVVIPLVAFCVGLSWISSSVGVYIRDLNQFIPVLISILMFTSPIFFPLESIPGKYRWLFEFNPLTFFIENARDLLYYGALPPAGSVLAVYLIGISFMLVGFKWFQYSKKGFADVL